MVLQPNSIKMKLTNAALSSSEMISKSNKIKIVNSVPENNIVTNDFSMHWF